MLTPEATGCLSNKKASARFGTSPFKLLVRNPRDCPKQYKLLPLLFVVHQNLIARPSCLRLHTHWAHREHEKLSGHCPGSFFPAGQLSQYRKLLCRLVRGKGVSLQSTYPAVNSVNCTVRYVHGRNSTKVIGAANCFVLGFKTCCTGGNTCGLLQVWPRTHGWGAQGPQQGTYYNLLIGHSIKLPSKFLPLYPD